MTEKKHKDPKELMIELMANAANKENPKDETNNDEIIHKCISDITTDLIDEVRGMRILFLQDENPEVKQFKEEGTIFFNQIEGLLLYLNNIGLTKSMATQIFVTDILALTTLHVEGHANTITKQLQYEMLIRGLGKFLHKMGKEG